jgi:hypothetical protein
MNTARKKSRKPRRALTQQERAAEFYRERDRIDRDLFRRIAAWAMLWEECPDAGCRRNGRCLQEDDCRMHTDEPWTEEDSRWVRDWLDNMRDEPAPKYDGGKVR